jgi:hypothetical protein
MTIFKKIINQTLNKVKDNHIIVDESIRFKIDLSKLKKLNESSVLINLKNKNIGDYGNHNHLSDLLHQATAKTINDQEKKYIHHYTCHDEDANKNYSERLNHSLINGTALHDHDQKIHDTIMKHAKPSGYSFHLFSGVKRNFKKMSEESGSDTFHFPAHTSTTHDIEIAYEFASKKRDDKNNMHLIHIHVKPQDKVLHISRFSENPYEHETILPAGTTLKYHGTTTEKRGKYFTQHIHHMTIHSQK